MKLNWLLICAISAVACSAAGCREDNPASINQNGTVDFRLDTLDRGRFYLNQHRNKVVMLAFWSTWCTVCKAELTDMKSFTGPQYKNLVVAAVCNDPENIDDLKSIIKSLDLNYPVLLDKKASVFNKLKMSAVPTTIVIDQSGKISLVREGYDSNIMQQIKSNIESLLASEANLK